MPTISDYYREQNREIKNRVTVGYWTTTPGGSRVFRSSQVITNVAGIKDLKIIQECDKLPIGVAVGATCSFTITRSGSVALVDDYIKRGNVVKIETGINNGSTFQYSILGYFQIGTAETSNDRKTIKVEASDDIALLDDTVRFVGTYNYLYDALQAFFPGAVSSTGASIAGNINANYPSLHNYSAREALGYIAGTHGYYLKMNRQGQVELSEITWWERWYNNETGHIGDEMMIFDGDRTITRIDTVNAGIQGNSGTASTGTITDPLPEEVSTTGYFDNPVADELNTSGLNTIAGRIRTKIENTVPEIRYASDQSLLFNAMAYSTGKLHMRGDPDLELGKSFAFNDGFGNTHRLIVCGLTIDMSGGAIAMDIQSNPPADSFTLSTTKGASGQVNAIKESNAYTDSQTADTLQDSKDYTDAQTADILQDAKDHTDEAVEDLKDYVDEQLAQLSTVEYFPAYARSTSSGTISPYGVYQYAVKDPMGAGEYSSIDCETPGGDDEYVRFAIPEALIPGARYRIIVRVVGGDGTAESEEILPHKIRLDAADGTPLSNFVQIDGSNPQSGAGFFFGAPALATGPSGTPWAQYNVSLYVNIPDSGEWPSHLSIYYQVALDMSGLGYTQSTSGYGYKNHQNGRLYISYTFASNAEKEAFVPPTMSDAGAWYYVNNRHVRSELRKAGVAERYVQGVQDQPWGSSAGLTVYQPLTVLYGDRLVLSDRTTQRESMLRASDIDKLKLGWEQKIFDKDIGIIPLHGGTANATYVLSDGIKSMATGTTTQIGEKEYSTTPHISGLNLFGVKSLRIIYRRDTSSNSAFGEFILPLEHPLPNSNGSTVYGEWFPGGAVSPTIGNANRSSCIIASIFYPTGGSLANCSFEFNASWTLYGTAVNAVESMRIVAIYVSY